VRARVGIGIGGLVSGEGRMGRGPSPGTMSGHLGEARLTWAAGPRQQRLKAEKGYSSEDHLGVSWADLCFIRGQASAGMGSIRRGGFP
jgi:hypothetical protein